jgi:hypothetical protein
MTRNLLAFSDHAQELRPFALRVQCLRERRTHPDRQLLCRSVEQAIERYGKPQIFNTDQGIRHSPATPSMMLHDRGDLRASCQGHSGNDLAHGFNDHVRRHHCDMLLTATFDRS